MGKSKNERGESQTILFYRYYLGEGPLELQAQALLVGEHLVWGRLSDADECLVLQMVQAHQAGICS